MRKLELYSVSVLDRYGKWLIRFFWLPWIFALCPVAYLVFGSYLNEFTYQKKKILDQQAQELTHVEPRSSVMFDMALDIEIVLPNGMSIISVFFFFLWGGGIDYLPNRSHLKKNEVQSITRHKQL